MLTGANQSILECDKSYGNQLRKPVDPCRAIQSVASRRFLDSLLLKQPSLAPLPPAASVAPQAPEPTDALGLLQPADFLEPPSAEDCTVLASLEASMVPFSAAPARSDSSGSSD